jgi:hypothetical protein
MKTLDTVREEPTLDVLLRSVAYTRLPTQFYQLLQLAIPFAFQFWSYGLYRTAGWMVVVSLFGLWALCVKRVDEQAEAAPEDRGVRWARIGRAVFGGLGGALATALALEGFVRFMASVFHCPGCAG